MTTKMAQETQYTTKNNPFTLLYNETTDFEVNLNSSLLFHLSLGSKELFHSNFLTWIASVTDFGGGLSGKSVFKNIFEKLGLTFPSKDEWRICREKNHFDLSIIDSSGRPIAIIENKVKSVPTLKQLHQYSQTFAEKIDRPKLLLLSLVKQFVNREEIEQDGWIIKSYGDLVRSIKTSIATITNLFYKSIFEDYILFIEELDHLVESDVKLDTPYFLPKDKIKQFDELRIGDLVQKNRFSAMAELVENYIKNSELDSTTITIVSKYTNSGGALLELWVPKEVEGESSPALCIQIQANRYAHAVYPIPNDDNSFKEVVKNSHGFFAESNKEFQENMKNKNEMFETNNCSDIPHLTFGKNSSTCFAYQYAVIKVDTTVRQLAEQIVSDLRLMLSAHIKLNNSNS